MEDKNLLFVFNCMFKNKWNEMDDELKEKFFFIVNRMLAKKYPTKAQYFNIKNIDKISAMDIWFNFMKNEPYPSWFWSKSPTKEIKIPTTDYKLLINSLKINQKDLDYLIENDMDFIETELKHFKKIQKQN